MIGTAIQLIMAICQTAQRLAYQLGFLLGRLIATVLQLVWREFGAARATGHVRAAERWPNAARRRTLTPPPLKSRPRRL